VASDRSAGLTAKAGRRFAWTLAAAFTVLAVLLQWRERRVPAIVAISLAVMLFLGGALVPSRLGPIERAWMGLARAISRVTTPIFLGIVYFLILAPIGFIRRTAGKSPIFRTASSGTFWVERKQQDAAQRRQRLERQF
jgi:saxitoxin biosynthesis operon SxtJ-like protein